MNKNKLFIGIAMVLLLVSIAYALEIKSGTSEDITIFLKNATDSTPIAGANCAIDIWAPNSTKILDDGAMNELGEGFYYFSTYTSWTDTGNYRAMVRCVVGSNNYYAAKMFKVVETTVTEWFETINETVSSTYDYLQNTLYPAVDEAESKLDEVLTNTSNIWNKLIEIQNNVTTNYNGIINTQTQLTDINTSIQSELDDHKQRLIAINQTLTNIFNNITLAINPKLDQLQADADLIKDYTDTLEAGQAQILANLSDIQTDIDSLTATTSAIENHVDSLENLLDCNGTTDTPICSKLDTINTTANIINTNTDSLESGQTAITNYVDTLESGQQTILNDLTTIMIELNCSSVEPNDICFRLLLIESYADSINTTVKTIEEYVDTLETGQQDLLNNITLVQQYTDTLETGLANLDSDLQSWNANATARFNTIDTSLSGITSTVDTLYLMLECNGSDSITLETQGLCDRLSKINSLVTDTNTTSSEIKDYLEGTITDYLANINKTTTDTWNLLVSINTTINSVYADTQDILTKWSAYNANDIVNKLDTMDQKLDNIEGSNNTDIINAIKSVEEILNNTRDEIGFEGQSLTAYEYFVQLESQLLEINTTIINKIEFEAGLTRTQIINTIQANTTAILDKINNNSNDITTILDKWGGVTAGDIIANITENRNNIITLQAWMIAFNETEAERHSTSQGLMNDVLNWLGFINQSEDERHNLTQSKIDNALLEINNTKNLINSLISKIGYSGKNTTLYDDIFRIIGMNNNITNIVADINLIVHEIKDVVIAMNQTLGLVYQNTQDILDKWSAYNASCIVGKLDLIDSQLDTISDENFNYTNDLLNSIANLELILNATRDELGFEGKSATAYEYLVNLDTELTEINSSLFAKIGAEAAQTRSELSAAIQSNVTSAINEIDANENKIDSIISKWGSFSAGDIINSITATRNNLIELDSWLRVFNSTSLNKSDEIYNFLNNAILFEINLTKNLANDLIVQIGFNKTNITLLEHLTAVNSSMYSRFDNIEMQLDYITAVTSEINITTKQIADEFSVLNTTMTEMSSVINSINLNYAIILNNTEILISKSDIIISKWGNNSIGDVIARLGEDYNVSLMEKWGDFDAQDLWDKLALIEYKVENLDGINLTINNTGVLDLLRDLRTEIGFNGTGETAYSYLVQLQTELMDINTTILNKIEFEAGQTTSQIFEAIQSNVSAVLNAVNLNSNDLAEILASWGNVSMQTLIDNISETRTQVMDMKAWLIAFNETEAARHNESQSFMDDILTWLGFINQTEAEMHNLTQTRIDEVFAEIDGTKALINQILVKIDYAGSNSTLYADIQGLINAMANITGSAGTIADMDYVILYNGSNLIAMPKQPSDISIEDVMANISGKYTRVDYYDSEAGVWLIYNPNAPFGNTLQTMEKGKAYWIYATAQTTLYIS